MSAHRLPPPRPAPDPLDDECVGLLREPFGSVWGLPAGRPAILRERVLDRVTRSARASRAFVTVRRLDGLPEALADGLAAGTLYEASSRPARPGEPRRVRILELAPGAHWSPDVACSDRSEWLVLSGDVRLGTIELAACDFHAAAAGRGPSTIASEGGARLYLREAPERGATTQATCTVRDASAGWADFAPGIKRRVLWAHAGEAALLYHALPGAQVPRHSHGHDEECLMIDGDIFLDDVLLRAGDYQLAPAGTVHGGVSTDTGLLLFAHGDLDLDIRAD